MIQPLLDSILVEVESEWKGEILTKSGVVGIVFENDIERAVGAQRKGTIVAVPRGVSPTHHYLSQVKIDLKVGDTVYFHFNSITSGSRVDIAEFFNEKYYTVPVDQLFVVVRDGKIMPFGDRVLCEQIIEDDVVTLDDGMKVKMTKSGIITTINVGHDAKRATLVYMGSPLFGANPLDVVAGDIVVYDQDADFENEVEGKKYFCMIVDDLLMKEL